MARRKHDEAFSIDLENDTEQTTGGRKKLRPSFSWRALMGKPSNKECVICVTHFTLDHFPAMVHKGTAEHTSEVCRACWEEHLRITVQEKTTDRIPCAQCGQLLDEPTIKILASKEVHNK